MTYKNKRPDSPKGQVYTKFSEAGAEAAIKFGLSLDIQKTKIERWISQWSSATTEPAKTAEKDVTVKHKGRRVYHTDHPNIYGTVVDEGSEVSEIKWDKPYPFGNDCYAANRYLIDVESEPSKTDKFVFQRARYFSVMNGNIRVGKFDTFAEAKEKAMENIFLLVYAVTKAGRSAMLQKVHWGLYESLTKS